MTPGGAFTAKSGKLVLKDTATGVAFNCTATTADGTFKTGGGLPGAGLGSIRGITSSTCTGPGGTTYTLVASASGTSPWQLNANSYNATSGVTTGTMTNVTATLSNAKCGELLAGQNSTTAAQLNISFTNSSHQLRFLLTAGTQHFWQSSTHPCRGVKNGDPFSFGQCLLPKPPQLIVDPPGEHSHGITGIGPPC